MSPGGADVDCRAGQVARAFFEAATKLSDDNEDILPQEDAPDLKLSVFFLFSELFPEFACDKEKDKDAPGKGGLMRLQFNKIGYEIYDKEQSRRVPAVRAKPGNPGYGFRRARWRNTLEGEDKRMCETVLKRLGVSMERIERVKVRVDAIRAQWESVRRPSRPAGPGRPRGHKRPTWDSAGAAPADAEAGAAGGEVPKKSKKKAPKQPKGGPKEDGKGGKDVAVPAVLLPPSGSLAVAPAQGQVMPPGESEAVQTENLVEENSSLRSLNMSLIYEREQLLREVLEGENNVRRLRKGIDSLITEVKGGSADGSRLGLAFGWMADRLFGNSEQRSESTSSLSEPQKEALEKCFDKFDEWEKQGSRKQPTSLPLRRELSKLLANPDGHAGALSLEDHVGGGGEGGLPGLQEEGVHVTLAEPDDIFFHHPPF